MTTRPDISVIIPTHNRRESVCRTLTALTSQSMSPSRFEVIVIADGCVDDTATFIRTLAFPFALRVIEQAGQGQGKARNVGAAAATGPILVFLDDDIEPLPAMLEAYEQSHRLHPRHLILGPAVPILKEDSSLFAQGLRNWWSDHIQDLKRASHRFSYRDMHSGNFSMSADLFAEARGFDSEFFGRSGEDYEFGIRLLERGIPFVVAAEATGFHHDGTDLSRSLVRVRMEGRADVLIGLRHPRLRSGLALASYRAPRSRLIRILRNLAFNHPGLGDRLAGLLRATLGPLEQLRVRRSWRAAHGALRAYWYCRGAGEELRTSASSTSLDEFFEAPGAIEDSVTNIDLDGGVDAAMRRVDTLRPAGVRLWLAGRMIGEIPAHAGAEPLRGAHLLPLLAGDACRDLLLGLSVHAMRSGQSWHQFFGETRTSDKTSPLLASRS